MSVIDQVAVWVGGANFALVAALGMAVWAWLGKRRLNVGLARVRPRARRSIHVP